MIARKLGSVPLKTCDILRKSHTRLIIGARGGAEACRSGLKAVILQGKRVIKREFIEVLIRYSSSRSSSSSRDYREGIERIEVIVVL